MGDAWGVGSGPGGLDALRWIAGCGAHPCMVPPVGDGEAALLVERAPGVVTATFNRPERLNAMTGPIYDALLDLALELRGDPSVRAVVLRGAGGRAFSAGNEISTFVGMTSGDEGVAYERGVRRVMRALFELEQVTIAAIDGVCVGGGLGLATFCDIRICTPASRFGYPIARTLGNALSAVFVDRCVATFGESMTREMLLTSTLVTAERAHAVGAVSAVVDEAELDAAVDRMTAGILQSAPLTIATTKAQLLARVDGRAAETGDDDRLRRVYGSADFREGVRAFVVGEKPRFTGA